MQLQLHVLDGVTARGIAILSHPPGCEDLAWISLANSQTDESLSIADSSMPPICSRRGGGAAGRREDQHGRPLSRGSTARQNLGRELQ